jgi:hypothetical protein
MSPFPKELRNASRAVASWALLAGIASFALASSFAADSAAPAAPLASADRSSAALPFQTNDVVAFVGGADVAVAQQTGHLETLLSARYRGLNLRFRNFGWEGDTVHQQPRDFGFPPLPAHLKRAGASVIFAQFGRTEALEGITALTNFIAGYSRLLDELKTVTPRLVLVTPPPYESAGPLLPDLAARNPDLARYSEAIIDLAARRGLPVVDVFGELGGTNHGNPRLTMDGLQLTRRGHAFVARAMATRLGFGELANRAGFPDDTGAWPNPEFERLRQVIIAKNRLWLDYWRPQNWAFLGGDRTTQPSSRDHRNPQVRWFPAEIEQFVPLIQTRERQISDLAERIPQFP